MRTCKAAFLLLSQKTEIYIHSRSTHALFIRSPVQLLETPLQQAHRATSAGITMVCGLPEDDGGAM